MNCSRCNSNKINKYKYSGVECYRCLDCGFDSCAELDDVSQQRTSQKAKGKYSPYKSGGKSRTR